MADLGGGPLWARNGRELFYSEGNRFMVVAVAGASGFATATSKLLFEKPNLQIYDVMPDGQHFVGLSQVRPKPITELQLVLNWFEELERVGRGK